MSVIKNFHKISDLIPVEKHNDLERGANLHLRHSNIEFKIIKVEGQEITIRAAQDKPMSENYADRATLIDGTKSLFERFIPNYTFHVQPIPYSYPTVDTADPEWIREQLLNTGTKIRDIQKETGIDKTNLSAWINGTRPMSQPVKAMFYYYFIGKRSI